MAPERAPDSNIVVFLKKPWEPPDAQAPERLGNRVKVDFRKLLSSMGQALTHGTFAFFAPEPATAAGSVVNAGTAIFGAIEAFEANAPLEVRAWYLLRNALANALGQLLGELHERRGPFQGDLEHLDNRFDLLLEGDGAVIDSNFLDNPRTLKLLPEIRRVLDEWLSNKVGLSAGDAQSLVLRLETHFAPALLAESRAHRDYYKPIYDHFEDRFAYAAQMDWDWERNRLALIQQFDDPVFERDFQPPPSLPAAPGLSRRTRRQPLASQRRREW